MARTRAANWIPVLTLLATASCGGDSPTEVEDPDAFQGCADVASYSIGSSVVGTLSNVSCTFASDATDFYEFELSASGTVTILLNSSVFDAYLILFDQTTGAVLAFDDDGGIDLNAMIVKALAAGTYVIGATSFDGTTGGYTMTSSQ